MPFLLSNFTFLFFKSASGFLERLEPLFNCLATKQRCLAALQRCLQVLLTYLEAKQRYIAAKHTCFVTKTALLDDSAALQNHETYLLRPLLLHAPSGEGATFKIKLHSPNSFSQIERAIVGSKL
jgi:hypothetical protein